jgi:hypothetical protein
MTTWIGIVLTVACLLAAETVPAAQTVGPRDGVEAAVARFMNIVQSGRSDGAAVMADRLDAIREIVREMGGSVVWRGARAALCSIGHWSP